MRRNTLSTGPALCLAAADGQAIPSSRADPDRPLGVMRPPATVPDQLSFESGIPNMARIYDALLGGKDNYAVDRDAARRLVAVVPGAVEAAQANRDFLARAVRFLAGPAGIDQFLDIGAGLPACGPVHEVARAVNPQARVVYADSDPVVAAHARALLAKAPGIAAVEGDVRRPLDLMTMREVRDVIDFDRPVGILLVAVLHFVSDAGDPWRAVACITERLAPGSYLVISHVTGDGISAAAVKAASEIYRGALVSGSARSRSEIIRFFGGLEVIEPGVVDVARWRRRARGRSAPPVLFYAGVGRKREGLS